MVHNIIIIITLKKLYVIVTRLSFAHPWPNYEGIKTLQRLESDYLYTSSLTL